jgi:formylglycine-generating enzyme required for sulfatase activity
LAPGDRPLPDFVLVQKLGEGGFGEVWKATGPGDVGVALKFIRLGDNAGAVEVRALEVIKDVRHAHLVGLFGTWRQQDQLILAMELADGSTVTLRARAGEARAEREFRVTVQRPPGIPKEALTLDLGGGVKLELVYIKEGEFWMGSPEDEPERNPFTDQKEANAEKRHRVQISKPFWLGKYAVTQEQYTRLTGKDNPSWFCATGGGKDKVRGMDTTRFPVETVPWDDAVAFCEELNRKHLSQVSEALRRAGYKFGLPTEAQWEYACRAGTETPFSFGRELNGKQANCDGNDPYGTAEKGP